MYVCNRMVLRTIQVESLRFLSVMKCNEYARCYKTLQLNDGSDQEAVRRSFIDLCKIYHPDSGSSEANAEKFQEIESAYRCLQDKFADERWNVNEGLGEYGLYYQLGKNGEDTKQAPVQEFDIKHTAPQHRQYLSYEGVGSGTMSQREKQYLRYRVSVAVENVYDHRVEKTRQNCNTQEQALLAKDKKEARKIKTRYGIERLVEDLIQESMSKGEFDNLSGVGKPIRESNYNPYVDFVTHKMNQIMIENGFVPEWITLHKEIMDETQDIKIMLRQERRKLGPHPLTTSDDTKWTNVKLQFASKEKLLNAKINKFNLLVPILDRQMVFFNLEKTCLDIVQHGEAKAAGEQEPNHDRATATAADNGFLGFLTTLFSSS